MTSNEEEIRSLTRRITEAVVNDTVPDSEDVERLAVLCPYFTAGAAQLLAKDTALTAEEKRKLSTDVALNASDPEALFKLCDPDGAMFADFYPPELNEPAPTTDTAIDTFLATYGNVDPKEAALIERLIFNPVADYSQVLAKEAEAEGSTNDHTPDSQDRLMDAFLDKFTPAETADTPEQPAPPAEIPAPRRHSMPKPKPDSLLSESLARIYIRQRRYEKAFEIISGLSLNYPEKSIYFADQLRFLQKLILNNKHNAQ